MKSITQNMMDFDDMLYMICKMTSCTYQICNRPQESIRSENLTGMQKE